MPIARRTPPPHRTGVAVRAAPVRASSPSRGRLHALDVPFPLRGVADAAGAAWDAGRKCYVFHGPRLPDALLPFAAQPYSFERFKEDEANGEVVVASGPAATITLRPHQAGGARTILSAHAADVDAFLEADGVGVGKTHTAIAAIKGMDDVDIVLVVCPFHAIAHWRNSIAAVGDGGLRWIVINYDRLKKLFDLPAGIGSRAGRAGSRKRTRRVRTLKGVARHGDPLPTDVIVWDESQRLKNPGSARSGLARKLGAASDFQIFMSATAGQDPIELAYLAPVFSRTAAEQRLARDDYPAWCQSKGIMLSRGKFGKLTWAGHGGDAAAEAARKRDLGLMRSLLFEGPVPVGIRRCPEDIAGWPAINRILMPMDMDPEDAHAYAMLWHVFRQSLQLEGGRKRDPQVALVEQLRFRQKSSLLRTSGTLDLTRDLLGQGYQVALSVAFHETSDVLAQALTDHGVPIALIDGRNPRIQESERMRFQRGDAKVVLYTPTDALSLHEGEHNSIPRCNVIHDLRWSGIEMAQIEGRCHRDGKLGVAYWCLGAGTVDEKIASVVAARQRNMSMFHGERDVMADIERALLSLQ